MLRGDTNIYRFLISLTFILSLSVFSTPLFSDDQATSFSTPEDQKFDILVPVNSKLSEKPSHGLLVDSGNKPGYKTYTPFKDYFGSDQFVMRSVRPDGKEGERTVVRIQVTPVNDIPIAADHVTSISENETASIRLSAFDVDRDPLIFSIVEQPKFGVLSGEAPQLSYQPSKDQKFKEDQFGYVVSDGQSKSRVAYVTILKGFQRLGESKTAPEEETSGSNLDIQINGATRVGSGEVLILSVFVNSTSGVSELRVLESDISGYEFNILGKNNNAGEFKWAVPKNLFQRDYFVSLSASNLEGQNRVKRVDIHVDSELVHDGIEYGKGSDKKKSDPSDALHSYGESSGNSVAQSNSEYSGTSGYFFGPYGTGLSYASSGSNNSSDDSNNRNDDQNSPPPPNNPNQPPVVNAGPDQTVDLPVNQFTLSGSVTDDGLPEGFISASWSQISGPASSVILSPSLLSTAVTVSESGDYVFKLSASDRELNASDDVVVHVRSSDSVSQSHPIADAGADQEWTLPEESDVMNVVLDGSRSFDSDGQIVTYQWGGTPDPDDAALTAISLSAGAYHFNLVVVDNDGLSSDPDEMTVTIHPFVHENQAPVVNAGPDATLTLPENQMNLQGSVEDDGYPSQTLDIEWSQVSGPGEVLFADRTLPNSHIVFPQSGMYVLKLTASDTALESSDQVTIQVLDEPPNNQPPVVNAGSDQQITLPNNQMTLSGSATDDGLPNGSLNILWEKVSGPGTAQFTNVNDVNTSVTFDQAGTYILRLTANDSASSAFDEMQAVVYINECDDPHNDQYYLLKPSDGFSVEITQNSQGKPTFRAVWNQEELRSIYPDETFFIDRSGGLLNTTYEILPKCGGVDIVYQAHNTTNQPLLYPELRIEGIKQSTTGNFYVLDPVDYGNVRNVNPNGEPLRDYYLGENMYRYPRAAYAPTMLTHDNHFVTGISLQYPYLEYKHDVKMEIDRVVSGQQQGTWRYRYHEFADTVCDTPNDSITTYLRMNPGEVRTYTISIRFTIPDKWITALYPYKVFFESLYGNNAKNLTKDRQPILGKDTSYGGLINANNPRGFDTTYRIDLNGWSAFISDVIGRMQQNGFARSLIWAPAGRYANTYLNQPPQFMDWPQPMIDSMSEYQRFSANGFRFGFYWGRPTEIPIFGSDPEWNPIGYDNADLNNPDHTAFLTNQLSLARDRGAAEIGLDYFFCMPLYDRYYWVDQMKSIAPQMNFCHEGAGPDLMHSKISNLYWPEKYMSHMGDFTQFSKEIEGPDALSWYLNHNSEIWAWYRQYVTGSGDNQVVHAPTFDTVQNLVRWGYTPLILVNSDHDIDIHGLSYTLPACFDDIDQDGDGFASWPYDPQCSSLTDEDESA